MLNLELVQTMAEKNSRLYHQDLDRILNTVFGEIVRAPKDVAGEISVDLTR